MNRIDPDDEEALAELIGAHLHTVLRKLPDEPYMLGVDLARIVVDWANDPGNQPAMLDDDEDLWP